MAKKFIGEKRPQSRAKVAIASPSRKLAAEPAKRDEESRQLSLAHQASRESDAYFRAMIDALPMAIYTTDVEGRLTYFNPAAVEFSRHAPEVGTDKWGVRSKIDYPARPAMPPA